MHDLRSPITALIPARTHLSLGTWLLVALVAAVVALLVAGAAMFFVLRSAPQPGRESPPVMPVPRTNSTPVQPAPVQPAPVQPAPVQPEPPRAVPTEIPESMHGTWRITDDVIERERAKGRPERALKMMRDRRMTISARLIKLEIINTIIGPMLRSFDVLEASPDLTRIRGEVYDPDDGSDRQPLTLELRDDQLTTTDPDEVLTWTRE